MSLALHGCTSADKGAVELSWNLIDTDGGGTTCMNHNLDQMRLWWSADGYRDFPCSDTHGVTDFEVPSGPALLRVEPRCAGGEALPSGGYIAPAPVQRTIVTGDVVELHAVVIEIVRTVTCPTPSP